MKIRFEWKDPKWTAVIAGMGCGVVSHFFGLVTCLHNNDDIGQLPYGYGTGISSGRWLLTILGDFAQDNGGNYNLPFLNGLMYLFLIALCAGVVVSIFRMKSRTSAALVGMLFSVFPSVAATMFFRYTTVYYGISMLLAVLAAWVLERYRFGLLWSAICMALSMGIYQAYIPFTIGIFVLLLIRYVLENQLRFWELVRKGLYYCAALVLGLILYYACLKLCLALYNTELSNYNGVNNMGKLAIADIPRLLKEAVYSFVMLPLKNYCGLSNMRWISISYVVLGVLTVVIVGYVLLAKVRKPELVLLCGVLCALFPVAVNFIVIMCPDGWIYTLMVYPFALIGCVPLVLFESLPSGGRIMERCKPLLAKVLSLTLAVLVFNYAYDTNINYTAMYYSNRQTENYLNALVVQVRMAEGFDTEKEWAFLGWIDDPLLRSPWEYEMRFGGTEPASLLINRETRYFWLQNYLGYTIPFVNEETEEKLSALQEVREMPCWPDEGSIKVIGDTVVVKFQDTEPEA